MTDYIEAHKFSSNNKEALQNDKKCGCFYCLKIFDPKEINFWIKDKHRNSSMPILLYRLCYRRIKRISYHNGIFDENA